MHPALSRCVAAAPEPYQTYQTYQTHPTYQPHLP